MRRRLRLLLSAILVAVALASCQADERSTPAVPVSDMGSMTVLAVGIAVALAPNLDAPAPAFSVAAGAEVGGRVTLQTYKPRHLARPGNGGRIEMVATAVLDARLSLALDGKPAQRLVLPVETPNRASLSFALPPLAPGHHCVVVGFLENRRSHVEGRDALDHRAMSAIDIDAGEGPDHCRAERQSDGVVDDELAVDCAHPALTNDPNVVPNGGEFKRRDRVWALVPPCADRSSVSVILHHNEEPVIRGPYAPFSAPNDGRIRRVDLGRLPPGSWRITVLASGQHSSAYPAWPALVG